MAEIKIGIIREGKVPHDFRVPLTPVQCAEIPHLFPGTTVIVQSSNVRRFPDQAYLDLGVTVAEDLSDCDILLGVKEVPVDMLIPDKTYLFFSHTIKKQPHNRALMQTLIRKRIKMIDYETIRDTKNKRLIGFGRYAGIVGAYEAFRTFGLKHGHYNLPSPSQCADRREMESHLRTIQLPEHTKIVVTGFGRVGKGAQEILDILPIQKVSIKDFVTKSFDQPVYLHIDTHEYYERKTDGLFDKQDFYHNPEHYFSVLPTYVKRADLFIACHLWASGNPPLISKHDLEQPDWKCMVIADVSCDTNGPIASTIRASKIKDPVYGYHRLLHGECDYNDQSAIAVMAIDNLPCELPADASEDFGEELIKHVLPRLLGDDPDEIIWKATITNNGELTPHFEYLHDYAFTAD
jgi:alanine dehydrogenase